jgi:hypothetical protein
VATALNEHEQPEYRVYYAESTTLRFDGALCVVHSLLALLVLIQRSGHG